MRIDTAKMRTILTAPIYLTARTDELQLEIAENCVALSCSRKEAHRMDLENLLDFLAQVKSERCKQLKQSGLPVNLIYYLWVDEQAGQLRFNFINANHSKLPFGCTLCRVESELDILTQFILISVENFKSACRFLASFPSFFSDDACIALQKTTGNPLKNHLRIF